MITQRRLAAGAPGTKKYVEKYGKRLICIRYKYDPERGVKLKTVELLESEEPWEKKPKNIPANKIVFLRVDYGEIHVGRLIRSAGGTWNREKKLWELPYGTAKSLGFIERIVWDEKV